MGRRAGVEGVLKASQTFQKTAMPGRPLTLDVYVEPLPISWGEGFWFGAFVQNGLITWPNRYDIDAIGLHKETKAAEVLFAGVAA